MDQALVEHAEHDIHRHQGRHHEIRLGAQRLLECLQGARKFAMNGLWKAESPLQGDDLLRGLAQRDTRSQVEGNRNRWKQSRVVHGERRGRGYVFHHARKRYGAASLLGNDIGVVQALRRLPILRSDLQHHVILVEFAVDGRNFFLSESAVQRAVQELRCDAEPRSRGAVVGQKRLQPLVLLVCIDVRERRVLLHGADQGWTVIRQIRCRLCFQRVLV